MMFSRLCKIGVLVLSCMSAQNALANQQASLDWVQELPSYPMDIQIEFPAAETPLMYEWGDLYLAGDIDALQEKVEANLMSDVPHRDAAFIWSTLAYEAGKFSDDGQIQIPGDLKEVLGDHPRDYWLARGDEYQKLGLNVGKQGDVLKSPWFYRRLSTAAQKSGNKEGVIQAGFDCAVSFPADYDCVWILTQHMDKAAYRDMLLKGLNENTAFAQTPAGQILAWYTQVFDRQSNVDDIVILKKWLKHYSWDHRAWRNLGHIMYRHSAFEEAEKAYAMSEHFFPFYDLTRGDHAKAIARLEQHQALSEKADIVSRYENDRSLSQEDSKKFFKAQAYFESGDLGRAVQMFEELHEANPNHRDTIYELGKIAKNFQRYEVAARYFEQVLKFNPTDIDAVDRLSETLREEERYEDALAHIATYEAAGGEMTDTLLYEKARTLSDLERHDEAVEVLNDVDVKFPDEYWLAEWRVNFMIYAERWEEAQQFLDILSEKGQVDTSSNWRYKEIFEATLSRDETRNLLRQRALEKPYESSRWSVLAAVYDTAADKVDVWKEAVKNAPNKLYMLYHGSRVFSEKEQFRHAYTVLTNLNFKIDDDQTNAGHLTEYYSQLVWVIESLIVEAGPDTEKLKKEADAALEKLLALGGDRLQWGRRSFWLEVARKDGKAAAEYLRDHIDLDIDAYGILSNVFIDAVSSHIDVKFFAKLAKMVRRRPQDAELLMDAAHRHLRWGGNPMHALYYLEQVDKYHPGYSLRNSNYASRSEAMGDLGIPKEEFLEDYGNGAIISGSERYVMWYKSKRHRAQGKSLRVVNMDVESLSVTTIGDNGIEIEKRYDPVSAELAYVRAGAASAGFQYDEEGRFVSYDIGGEKQLVIKYGPVGTSTEDQVIEAFTDESQVFELFYPTTGDGGICAIAVKNDGIIYTDSDYEGRCDVGSYEGKESSVDVMAFLGVSSKISGMQSIIRQAKSTTENALSEIPYEDETYDKLYETYEDSRWNEGSDVTAFGQAGLNVLTYAVDHLADRFVYQETVQDVALDLIDRYSYENREIAFKSLLLWKAMQQQLRPHGMPLSEYKLWQEWLTELEEYSDNPFSDLEKAAYAELQTSEAKTPLKLLDDNNWLEKTPLRNPGFWTLYDSYDVWPKLGGKQPVSNDILVRHNGDVVVAGDLGLAVLRRGFWEWFILPTNTTAFQNGDMDELPSRYLDVTQLHEDEAGRLWLASSHGLIYLEGDYKDNLKIWKGEMDGIPGGVITSMKSDGNILYVGTRKGLVTFTEDGPVDKAQVILPDQQVNAIIHAFSNVSNLDAPYWGPEGEFEFGVEGKYWLQTTDDAGNFTFANIVNSETDVSFPTGIPAGMLDVVYPNYDENILILLTTEGDLYVYELADDGVELVLETKIIQSEFREYLLSLSLSEELLIYRDSDLTLKAFEFASREIFDLPVAGNEDMNLYQITGFDLTKDLFYLALDNQKIQVIDVSNRANLLNQDAQFIDIPQNAFYMNFDQNDDLYFRTEQEVVIAGYRAISFDPISLGGMVVAHSGGVSMIGLDGQEATYMKGNAIDIIQTTSAGDVAVLMDGNIYQSDDVFDKTSYKLMPAQGGIIGRDTVHKLVNMPVGEGGAQLGVLTDQGLSLYKDFQFTHLRIPKVDQIETVKAVSNFNDRVFMLSGNRVAAVEMGQVQYDRDQLAESKLVYAPRFGGVYAANENGLYFSADDSETGLPELHSYGDVDSLVLANDGAVLYNDGYDVIRLDPVDGSSQTLFTANPTEPAQYRHMGDIIQASDGAVWFATGASVFRWMEGQETAEEFSIYADEEKFPVRSDLIYHIFENPQQEVIVVASYEAHLYHNGRRKKGGLYKYTGEKFVAVEEGKYRPERTYTGMQFPYLLSQTKISDELTIWGYTDGVILENNLGTAALDPSFAALEERVGRIRMVSKGVQISDDLWLFGSSQGSIAYQNNQWFFPDKLNWMLPDQHLAQYGGRYIHSTAVAGNGRIYMSTDRGLMVYDPLGASPENFLIQNGRQDHVFISSAHQQKEAVDQLLLANLDPDGETAKVLESIKKRQQKVRDLQDELKHLSEGVKAQSQGDNTQTTAGKGEADDVVARLEKKLKKEERNLKAKLSKLERTEPSLHQMLNLKPMDLLALQDQIPENGQIVQYLPTKDRLFIHLVTNEKALVREVEIGNAELYAVSNLVAAQLAKEVHNLSRGAVFEEEEGGSEGGDVDGHGAVNVSLDQGLRWLYDQLLRPIENDLDRSKNVYISAVGTLNYIPFAALDRGNGENHEYAIEKFNLGYVPSLYYFNVVKDHEPWQASSNVIFADTDGSLPGAREEAEFISSQYDELDVSMRVGDEGTIGELQDLSEDARILHLAVHGKLNHEKPEASYLQLAEGYRMDVIDVMGLPLSQTDLVFLSACETGIGPKGLEYATLARSFAHAGAPTTIATLWKVDDKSTKELATNFYQNYEEYENAFVALAKAQRHMIAQENELSHPAAWSPFIIYGL